MDTSLEHLSQSVRMFCDDRDWAQFHNPKDLAIGMATEASELLELFRFQDSEQMNKMLEDGETREKIGDELADQLYFLLRFADLYGFDLAEELNRKIGKNAMKYPVDVSRGSNRKV
ncbi:nucleotide pyrophosphohydrolase [Collinsella ihumii]|uniref:Nucleotide pyrophosphohydrolase n=1 Tax=Collinsella ihumii TaxID=1720204 RepID=A0ABT7XBU3_9ACTN|nr:nucleotide pyrophosphohydrolase [Collinsella ihumii]MDN0062888.1 nucleotide pyrophosphohydrolase [Collinsella ihumii]